MNYHFVGIGGIGMSALAQVLAARGHAVRGSEKTLSKTAKLLEKAGVKVHAGHDAAHVDGASRVVWSSAIAPDNPEIQKAQEQGIALQHRAELLAELANPEKSIAIAGMHGKTTTTNMMFHVLRAAGMDPTLVSGGIDVKLGSNAYAGKDPVLVLEADESDGSLVHFRPHSAVLTNCEEEHMGFYKNIDHILSVFATFAGNVNPQGVIAYCSDDKNLRRLARSAQAPFVSYGLRRGARIRAKNVVAEDGGMRFDVLQGRKRLGSMRLAVAGLHNVCNALAVITVGLGWNLSWEAIRRGLEGFGGSMRRLENKGVAGGVAVLDDYAHHPTEVKASLKALAGQRAPGVSRLIVVFQPHRYSRVRHLAGEFAGSFFDADSVIITPVYSAGEPDEGDVNHETLVQRLRQAGHKDVRGAATFREAAQLAAQGARPGDTIVGMGAGDIEQFAGIMKEVLLSRQPSGAMPQPAEAVSC